MGATGHRRAPVRRRGNMAHKRMQLAQIKCQRSSKQDVPATTGSRRIAKPKKQRKISPQRQGAQCRYFEIGQKLTNWTYVALREFAKNSFEIAERGQEDTGKAEGKRRKPEVQTNCNRSPNRARTRLLKLLLHCHPNVARYVLLLPSYCSFLTSYFSRYLSAALDGGA